MRFIACIVEIPDDVGSIEYDDPTSGLGVLRHVETFPRTDKGNGAVTPVLTIWTCPDHSDPAAGVF